VSVSDVDEFGSGRVNEGRDQINGELDVVEAQLQRLARPCGHVELDVITKRSQQRGLEPLVDATCAVRGEVLRRERCGKKHHDVDVLKRPTHRLPREAPLQERAHRKARIDEHSGDLLMSNHRSRSFYRVEANRGVELSERCGDVLRCRCHICSCLEPRHSRAEQR